MQGHVPPSCVCFVSCACSHRNSPATCYKSRPGAPSCKVTCLQVVCALCRVHARTEIALLPATKAGQEPPHARSRASKLCVLCVVCMLAQASELALLQKQARSPLMQSTHTAVRASLGLGLGLGVIKGLGLGVQQVRVCLKECLSQCVYVVVQMQCVKPGSKPELHQNVGPGGAAGEGVC